MLEIINKRIKSSLKGKQKDHLAGWRSVKSKATNKLTSAGRQQEPLSDKEWLDVIKKELKERQEANSYLKPNQPDYQTNQVIIDELQTLLPLELNQQQLEELIKTTLQACDSSSPKLFATAMGKLKTVPGVNMAKAAGIVKQLLNS